MNDYIELRLDVNPCSETATDILAAMLADCGYESFVPDSSGLTAYIQVAKFSEKSVAEIVVDFPMAVTITSTHKLVPGQDWNHEWEKNYFKPIVVADCCVIHSSFHQDVPTARYDIVIDPKMAFGTGHHATTSSVIEQLLKFGLAGKRVIDMGTGTGILSILSVMAGAEKAVGIEIDPAAYANAVENVRLNGVDNKVDLILGDAAALDSLDVADIFIANINRNIITADLHRYTAKLKRDGAMLLSGFYESDIPVIMKTASAFGLAEHGRCVKSGGWVCLTLAFES